MVNGWWIERPLPRRAALAAPAAAAATLIAGCDDHRWLPRAGAGLEQARTWVTFPLTLPQYLPDDVRPVPEVQNANTSLKEGVVLRYRDRSGRVVLALHQYRNRQRPEQTLLRTGERRLIGTTEVVVARPEGSQRSLVIEWIFRGVHFDLFSSLPLDETLRVVESLLAGT
jgi:hypothetical protein